MFCHRCANDSDARRRFCTHCRAFLLKPNMERASVANRVAAGLLDMGLGSLVTVLALVPVIRADSGAGTDAQAKLWIAGILIVYLGIFLFGIARGWSPGKLILGLRFVRRDGSAPGLRRALVREVIGKVISGMFMYLGFLWALWDPDSATWHDKLAGTLVVRLHKG